jgi:uncharacterized protein YjbI with pentapeptide repeats
MANPEHVQLVQREDWNKWRANRPDIILDLSSAKLSGAGLSLADLSGADLSGADLRMANLSGTDLRRATLRLAILRGANLSLADLRGANLNCANLLAANLSGADLRTADLSMANLSSAELSEAQLSGATLRGTNLDWANLALANLTKARLARTNFGGANMLDAKGLEECEFGGPCILDIRAVQKSGKLPLAFLRGCGLPDSLIDYLPYLLQEATQFFSCVISYSHKNEAFAKRLFETLQGRSIRCWLDDKGLIPGDDIYEPVDRDIPTWDKIVLCCSEASLTSWWVDNEIRMALEREQQVTKERGERVEAIIPLNLDDYIFGEGWKSGYRVEILHRLTANFLNWETDDATFNAQTEMVIQALRSGEGGRPQAPKLML